MIGRLLIMAGLIGAATRFLPGIEVSGGLKTYLWIAILFSIINALLEIPLTILHSTFALIPVLLLSKITKESATERESSPNIILTIPLLVIIGGLTNAGLMILVAQLTSSMWFDSFGTAFLLGVVISVVRFFISPSAI